MAFDVNIDALFDSDLLEPIVVQRRTDTVGTNGRTSKAVTPYRTAGVVTAASPDQLERLEGYQVTGRAIAITTSFKLQGEVNGFQPDQVDWRGTLYVVKVIDSFVQYGRGFYVALATSVDTVDEAFSFPQPGQLAFNNKLNSAWIGA